MVLQWIWFMTMAASLAYALGSGREEKMLEAALAGTGNAVSLTLQLAAGYLLFCGLMEIVKAAGVQRGVQKLFRPLLARLFPSIQEEEAKQAVLISLSMNVLGLGNAATPAGVKAMRLMEEERVMRPSAVHDMEMFLILNATGLQLLPTTVLTLRAAAESARVNAVIVPVLLCTAFSTLIGVGMGILMRKKEAKKA